MDIEFGEVIMMQHGDVLLNHKDEAACSLDQYLASWDESYTKYVSQISLFNPQKTTQWSAAQQKHFVKTFYHVRGHFHCFLWFMGNFAPDKASKDMILQNIIDELGDQALSHEKLYHIFAEHVEVDIVPEMLEQKTYLPFIQEFNKGHLRWLSDKDWPTKVSAFAALKRLDNVDYVNAKAIAESLGLCGQALTFFAEKAKYAFQFIKEHQINMWQNLSNEIFGYV